MGKLKTPLYYALKPGWNHGAGYRPVAVTSERNRHWHGRDLDSGSPTHGRKSDLTGRFETAADAEKKVAGLIAIDAYYEERRKIAADAVSLRHAEERRATQAFLKSDDMEWTPPPVQDRFYVVWNGARNEGVVFDNHKDAWNAQTGEHDGVSSSLADEFHRMYGDDNDGRPLRVFYATGTGALIEGDNAIAIGEEAFRAGFNALIAMFPATFAQFTAGDLKRREDKAWDNFEPSETVKELVAP